jgi:hypothetical protein
MYRVATKRRFWLRRKVDSGQNLGPPPASSRHTRFDCAGLLCGLFGVDGVGIITSTTYFFFSDIISPSPLSCTMTGFEKANGDAVGTRTTTA